VTRPVAGAVIFDMDGVLLDSEAHHRDAWRQVLTELGVEPPPDFWRRTIGRPAEEAVALLLDRPVEAGEAEAVALRKREHYRRLAARGMLPVRGVPAFLELLAAEGVPRAVATSGGAWPRSGCGATSR
jgi:beta-phosphoglucomutase-like phosphatase (HAD superfamily)